MVMVEETYFPMTLYAPAMSDAQFQDLCEQYSDYRLEYTAEGDLSIMPPTDPITGVRNSDITYQLKAWALAECRGEVSVSSAGFLLPDTSRLSPDAAWMSRDRLFSRPSCPQFVIELLSPSDRPNRTREKMLTWIANGAELGWMIDPASRTVTIYRPGCAPEAHTELAEIRGVGCMEGFVLNLERIWRP